jgi:hypothetical protein
VEVSTGNATDPTTSLSNTVIHLPKRIENMTKPVTGWAAQGVGVRTVNTYSCQIYIGNIVNFAKNLQCTSFGMGNVYNDYFLRHLENGKVNLDLTPGNAGAWVNENNFFGGRLSHYSAEGTDVAGVRHVYIAASVNSVNNNLFIKPSIEGNVAEFHVECGGSQNTFQQARWEASTPKLRFFGTTTNHGGRNILLGGYGLQDVVVSSSGTTGGNTSIQGGAEQVVVMGSSGKPLRFKNQSANTSAVRQYYDTSGDPFANGSDWTVFESARELRGKRSTDANPRIKIDYHNGAIYFDNGTTAVPTAGFTSFGADSVACSSPLYASTNDAFTCGAAAYRWSIVHATTLSPGTVGTTNATRVKWTSGTGSPESVLTAIVGSMYTRTDGGSGTTLYVKESGAGSTGWVAK